MTAQKWIFIIMAQYYDNAPKLKEDALEKENEMIPLPRKKHFRMNFHYTLSYYNDQYFQHSGIKLSHVTFAIILILYLSCSWMFYIV